MNSESEQKIGTAVVKEEKKRYKHVLALGLLIFLIAFVAIIIVKDCNIKTISLQGTVVTGQTVPTDPITVSFFYRGVNVTYLAKIDAHYSSAGPLIQAGDSIPLKISKNIVQYEPSNDTTSASLPQTVTIDNGDITNVVADSSQYHYFMHVYNNIAIVLGVITVILLVKFLDRIKSRRMICEVYKKKFE